MKQVLSTVLFMALLPATAPVASAQDAVARGQKVFGEQKCSICHAVGAQGNKKGILDGVGSKLSADEIRQWITNAPEMVAKAKTKMDRKPPMKAYGTLPKADIDALVAYLSSLKA